MGVCENFPSGPFREHADASGGAHEAIEGLGIRADLGGQFGGGFGSVFDEVRDTELREASDGASDVNAIHDLEDADVRRRSLRLRGHAMFTWIEFSDCGTGKYSLKEGGEDKRWLSVGIVLSLDAERTGRFKNRPVHFESEPWPTCGLVGSVGNGVWPI